MGIMVTLTLRELVRARLCWRRRANLDGVRYPTYVGDLEEAADTAPLLTTTPPGPPVQTAPQH